MTAITDEITDPWRELARIQRVAIERGKRLLGEERFNRWRASARGMNGVVAMGDRYFDRLRQLTIEFDAAFMAGRKAADPFAWQFFDDYNPVEVRWLYESEYF